jgi:hypothetical protein
MARFLRRLTKEKRVGSGVARAGTDNNFRSYALEPVLTSVFAYTFRGRPAESHLLAPEPDKSARKSFAQEVS